MENPRIKFFLIAQNRFCRAQRMFDFLLSILLPATAVLTHIIDLFVNTSFTCRHISGRCTSCRYVRMARCTSHRDANLFEFASKKAMHKNV